MVWQRWLVAVVIAVLGFLMGWDANVWTAAPWVTAVVSLAIAIPAVAGLLLTRGGLLAGAVLVSAILLLATRLLSGIELRWYAMAFVFGVVLLIHWIRERRPGGGAPAHPRPTA